MIQTTQTWKDYSVDHSNYHPLIVVIKDGNIIWTFDSSNIKEGSLRFTDDITDLGDFNIGATPSNSFECDIINFDNTFPSPDTFKGCRANLYFFLERPEFGGSNAVAGQAIVGQAIVGTESTWTDYIKRGVYYLDPVNSVGRTVHISGSDAMSLPEFNSANMSGFSFSGLTCYQAIKKMGFNLQHTFPNSDYVLPNVVCNEESNLANVTKRTALGYIASLCGCYARHDNNGELRLSQFALSTPTSVTKIMQEPNLDYYPVTVTGVFVSGTEGSYSVKGSDGYYLFVENNPLITSPSIADEIATSINTAYNGLSIYPFSLSYIADPSLQAGDTIDITYNGNTTTTIVTSFQYALGNQSTLEMSADVEEHSSAEALIASIPGTKLAIQDLYKGDVLKKIINLSADEVQIDAQQMNINGVVSANGNFRVNTDGTIEAVNGVFSGTVNASSGSFTGTVNATSGSFTGTVTSSSGTIGGFSIESNNLHNGMTSLNSTESGVYVGTDGIGLGGGKFKVTSIGELNTVMGKIGAWFINDYGLRGDIEYAGEQTSQTFSMTMYSNTTGATLTDFDYQYPIELITINPSITPIPQTLFAVTLSGKVKCVSVQQSSDRRLKEHVKYLDENESAEFIYSLKPVEFKYLLGDKKTHRGFYAQEVQEVSSDDWSPVEEDEKGTLSLAYTEIIADLVATVQSLNKRIEELEKKHE